MENWGKISEIYKRFISWGKKFNAGKSFFRGNKFAERYLARLYKPDQTPGCRLVDTCYVDGSTNFWG